jgi:hypothetical protein
VIVQYILNPGSVWVGSKPKDGDILTPYDNVPPYVAHPEIMFRYDEKNDKLIPINNGKDARHQTEGERPTQD